MTTQDPDLCLLSCGRRVRAVAQAQGCHRFVLTDHSGDIRILSRSVVPAHGANGVDDGANDIRRLGVPVRAIFLQGDQVDVFLHACDRALETGFHDAETGHRWTDGAGVLADALLRPLGRSLTVDLFLASVTLSYEREPSV